MPSEKDQCFADAIRAYEDATGKDLKIEFEQPWVQDVDGTWSRPNKTWWNIVNGVRKTWRWLMGDESAARPDGSSLPNQVRRPDFTVEGPDGKPIVVDNKFTDANGKEDPWRTQPGQGNGKTQQEDYNDINRQNNPGDKPPQDMKLSKEECKCDGEPEKETVPVTVPSYGLVPVPLPEGVPGFAPAPGVAPVEPMPGGFGIPELVFP
jgi:hypothetical protein